MIDDPYIGRIVADRFRIVRRLGAGQMAVVYAAEQLSMGREVALKLLRRELLGDTREVTRFAREVSAVARLTSPHTIGFYDFGKTRERDLFIAMELLRGETLREHITRTGALPPDVVVRIVKQLASSLGEAHSEGIIHRDVKPQNVFFSQQPTPVTPFVKVLDFGLAKLQEPPDGDVHLTGRHMTVGTPAYLPPERAVVGRAVDWRSDLYALGVMTFEMLCGELPYAYDNPMKMVTAHIREPIPSACAHRAGLPEKVDNFFAAAMAKDPNERFVNVDALASALELALKPV